MCHVRMDLWKCEVHVPVDLQGVNACLHWHEALIYVFGRSKAFFGRIFSSALQDWIHFTEVLPFASNWVEDWSMINLTECLQVGIPHWESLPMVRTWVLNWSPLIKEAPLFFRNIFIHVAIIDVRSSSYMWPEWM